MKPSTFLSLALFNFGALAAPTDDAAAVQAGAVKRALEQSEPVAERAAAAGFASEEEDDDQDDGGEETHIWHPRGGDDDGAETTEVGPGVFQRDLRYTLCGNACDIVIDRGRAHAKEWGRCTRRCQRDFVDFIGTMIATVYAGFKGYDDQKKAEKKLAASLMKKFY